MMSQLAMATASTESHSTQSSSGDHHSMPDMPTGSDTGHVKGVKANVKNCSCCDEAGDQTCPDSACQCDVCVSALVVSIATYIKPVPHSSENAFNLNALLEQILTVTVPPPISAVI